MKSSRGARQRDLGIHHFVIEVELSIIQIWILGSLAKRMKGGERMDHQA